MAMTKDEIIEAINSTIVANGQKGITAESLNNILTEITNTAGEGGSGSGALKLMMPDQMVMGAIIDEVEEFGGIINLENVSYILDMYKAYMPEYVEAMYPFYEKMFAHNAEIYNKLLEKASNFEGTFILLDTSESFALSSKYMMGAGDLTLEASIAQLASVMAAQSSDPDFLPATVTIEPLDGVPEYVRVIPKGYAMELNSAGELRVTKNSSAYLYIPTDSTTLDDDQTTSNINIYDTYNVEGEWENVKIKLLTAGASSSYTPNVLSFDTGGKYFIYIKDLNIIKATLASDGSVTVTTIGSINAAS